MLKVERIRMLRSERGLSIAGLRRAMEREGGAVADRYLRRVLRGERLKVNHEAVLAMARSLGTSVEDIASTSAG